MRKTRPQDYDPNFQQSQGPQPEEIDMKDIVPLKARSPGSASIERELLTSVQPERDEPSERPVRPERIERDERPARPLKRQLKRHSFDIYIDQLEALRELKIAAMRRGEERSLSKMTREALAAYLQKER